tara:strand:+ start:1347 stop:1556 length:210 start_codon:yes stop_codon:yes gene_type:complete
MPKYGGVHYPNDVKGVTNGYPEHVPNGDGGAYGDSTKKSEADGGVGARPRKGVLNKRDASAWKYPKPVR